MIEEISQNGFTVKCMDGAEGMLALPDKSIKLVYGSPPYPNAERDYGVWRAAEYGCTNYLNEEKKCTYMVPLESGHMKDD